MGTNKILIRRLAFAAVVAFCIHIFSHNKADVDLWGNVGFVKAMPWSSDFHRTNTFSFTDTNHPWTNHEWLAEYIFNAVHGCFGNTGLLAIKIFLGLCVVFLINVAMKAECRSNAVRFLLLLLIISTMGYGFSIRPHHFTYLMCALFLLLLGRYGGNRIVAFAVVPLLGVLWTNLHGAFFIGAILLAVAAISETIAVLAWGRGKASWRAAVTPCVSTALFAAGTFINPYGGELWKFIFRSAALPRPYLSEWAPATQIAHYSVHPDFVALALITLVSMFLCRFRAMNSPDRAHGKEITRIVVFLMSFCAALLMRRNIPLFAITAGCLAAGYVDKVAGPALSRLLETANEKLLAGLLAAFILLSGCYAATFDKSNPLEVEVAVDKFPVDIVEFMAANDISGNALVFFDWAEYCIWKLYPECKVFLDGRFSDAYRLKTINDFFAFLYAEDNWRAALTEYPTDIVLIHRGNPIHAKMLAEPGWTPVAENEIAVLFLKKDAHQSFFDAQRKGLTVSPPNIRRAYFP